MAEKQALTRYESSQDLHDAWLKAIDMDLPEIGGIWKESILTLRVLMRQDRDLNVSLKAAQQLSKLLTDISKVYSEIGATQKGQRGGAIDVDMNPFAKEGPSEQNQAI